MAVTMKDVKAISIPVNGTDKVVNKIEDANGNIIWGSQAAFPYRRLEYIHFSGAEWLDTGNKPSVSYHYLQFKPTAASNKCIIGCGGDNNSSGIFRWLLFTNSTGDGFVCRCGRNSSSNVNLGNFNTNNIYESRMRTISTSNVWFGVYDLATGSAVGTQTYSSGISFNPANMPNIQIMRYDYSTGQGNYNTADVYAYYVRSGDGSTAKINDRYPCQRKSDGVCGLYDILTNTFYPMQGTTITDAAAGPIVDEYWDLTAPA